MEATARELSVPTTMETKACGTLRLSQGGVSLAPRCLRSHHGVGNGGGRSLSTAARASPSRSSELDSLFSSSLLDDGALFDRRLDQMFRESERMQEEVQRQLARQRGQTYRRESRSEEKTANGYRKTYSSVTIYGGGVSQGRAGLTQGAAGTLPILLPVLAWAVLGSRFYSAFSLTRFRADPKTKVTFSLLWPLLCLVSARFRKEFWGALRGSGAAE